MNNISQNLKRFASIQRSLHTVPTSKISCFTCRYYKEVVSATDIFPNDRKKCAKFVNIIFRDKELTNENTITNYTTYMARFDENMCGSSAKYYTPRT